ncbi:MAG: Na+/H+ antiporter subunit E [Burkholderiales bacterium]|jgi:multicomponent Na+:H+ antiporter subunit E
MRLVSSFLVLFAFWLLLSGHYTGFLVGAGAVCALGVVLFARRMDVVDREGHPVQLVPRALLFYWPWLIKEIFKSALQVAVIILHPRLPISPVLLRVRATQKTDVGRTTFANSITLTPGTISVDVGDDEILVHALTQDGASGLANGEMDRRVTRFEGA